MVKAAWRKATVALPALSPPWDTQFSPVDVRTL